MNLDALFSFIDSLLGDIATFQGLAFTLEHGFLIIDTVTDYEYEGEIVNGFIIDFAPYDELQSPGSYFALDEEGVKAIISDFILE